MLSFQGNHWGKRIKMAQERPVSTPLDRRKSDSRLLAVLDTVVDAVITIDEKGIMQSFNRAAERIFGFQAGEVLGRNVNMLMPEPYHSEHDRYLDNYLTTGVKKIIGIGREVTGRRKDGTTFPMELAVSETWVGDQRIFTGIIRDITERREAEMEREALITELEMKNAEMERFTYTVSHDLKSPLITIRGFLGHLEKDMAAGNEKRVKEDIGHIQVAVVRMQTLLDELLTLSRVGRISNPRKEIDMGELAREAAAQVGGRIAEGKVEVVIAPDLPTVEADSPRIYEVLQNLVDNAVKFMGDQPHPRVEIGVQHGGEETIFFVRDNGIGIDPRYHQKIFGLFERLDADTDGTGIGLSLVKRIIEVHGGRIWLESEPGQGSTFFFTLPQGDK
jgi:two-component system, LuxR family, sensor kinase FixL